MRVCRDNFNVTLNNSRKMSMTFWQNSKSNGVTPPPLLLNLPPSLIEH